MKYVLDTNAVSALMKGDQHAIGRLEKVDRSDVWIPQVVVAEIHYGIERLPKSKRRDTLQTRLNLLTTEIGRIEWTDEGSRAFGHLKAALEKRGRLLPDFDIAIAAHALAHEATLVTADGDFGRIPGLTIENWAK